MTNSRAYNFTCKKHFVHSDGGHLVSKSFVKGIFCYSIACVKFIAFICNSTFIE